MRRKYHNVVVVKLDMEKVYDRVSWVYLIKVLRRFGFSEIVIDLVWRLLTNNWYSILVNGKVFGFFRPSRGLNQGDPLSRALFITAAEVLARGLKNLHEKAEFRGYEVPEWNPTINHLSYAYDTILFCSGDKKSISLMMDVLRRYELISGQMINLKINVYYLYDNTPLIVGMRPMRLTRIKQGNFPFNYLGFPVFRGRRKR